MRDRDSRQSSHVPRFVRDVGVNLVANLLTAIVVYVLGALAGVFPRTAAFYVLTAVLLTAVGALVLMAVSFFVRGSSGLFWAAVAALLTSPLALYYVWFVWNRAGPSSTLTTVLLTALAAAPTVAGSWLLLGRRWPRLHPWWLRNTTAPKAA